MTSLYSLRFALSSPKLAGKYVVISRNESGIDSLPKLAGEAESGFTLQSASANLSLLHDSGLS
jgi:hypothetical protein